MGVLACYRAVFCDLMLRGCAAALFTGQVN